MVLYCKKIIGTDPNLNILAQSLAIARKWNFSRLAELLIRHAKRLSHECSSLQNGVNLQQTIAQFPLVHALHFGLNHVSRVHNSVFPNQFFETVYWTCLASSFTSYSIRKTPLAPGNIGIPLLCQRTRFG